ncbi:hypothetical protein EVAR_16358_1 [Eumeta japonica]|uniref:Uncharacterized protein n=1 Tax=Eumeta variegata TaxID=151549 RepID=A0A4C1VV45_EUMVA|nr:hypothetical protein EVAR_16358_1 [Eumeta japonica]
MEVDYEHTNVHPLRLYKSVLPVVYVVLLGGVSETGDLFLGRRTNRALFYSVKSAVSSGITRVGRQTTTVAVHRLCTRYSRGGALRTPALIRRLVNLRAIPYRRPWLHQRTATVLFGFKALRDILYWLAVDKNGLGESRTVHL